MPTVKLRLVILTEIIAPYRIPVFNALARRAEIDLHVIFLAETDESLRQWRVYKEEICFSYQVLRSRRWRVGRTRSVNILINCGLWPSLQRTQPRVILCGGYNYAASWEALSWARWRRAGFVLWAESNRYDARGARAWLEFLKVYFVRHCDKFVVPGKASGDYLRMLGAMPEDIFTAPNAIENDLFAREAAKVREQSAVFRSRLKLPSRYILFVGRMVAEKGIFDLLEAYALLSGELKEQVGLVFAGDGAGRLEAVRRAQRIKPGTVCIPGFAQREDLAGLYALADMLVLPTHSDPWGLVVNEAMACGLPIVVTSVAGCSSDLVEDGWNGYIVPPRDIEKLAAAIDCLLRQPEAAQGMRLHSLERVRNYSPAACADGLAQAAISAMPGARCSR